ncbi:MAG TPA: SdpI family protein [Anaerolineales bacterium]|jgi:uncharacterized membrane protein
MKFEWKHEWMPIAAIVLVSLGTLFLYGQLPDPMPIHWNLVGQPDNFAAKTYGAFLLPATAVGIYLLLLVIPHLDPRRASYERFEGTYRILRTGIVLFMVFIQLVTLYSVLLGGNMLNSNLVILAVGLLFVLLGNYMPRVRSNWFVGIRTPWTLSNEHVWRKTHQLGGRLFVLTGLLLMASVVLPPSFSMAVILSSIVVCAVIPMGYSYWLYRRVRNEPEAS